jgi:hypothetical protein
VAVAAGRPRLRAVRIDRPPVIDGRLDDGAWAAVPATEAFTQKFPAEGRAPTEKTRLRIAYDDGALYVSFDCEQRLAPIVGRLTRRDRQVESDLVEVVLDPRRDGKSAFMFTVNAAGVLSDWIRFDDTESSADWDENWEAAAALTGAGWSAELRIPLRILRFASLPLQEWGFQARRYVSERQETDEWTFIPRSAAGEVSRYGRLENLERLPPGRGVELNPFVWGRARRRDLEEGRLASGTDFDAAAGLDVKWHPTQELTVDAAALPDFAQVEADQVVLNLSNIETNYPEKRRFFLEGIDYSELSSFTPAAPGERPTIHLADLRPGAPAPASNPDTQEAGLNANLVLRWEFRPGSLMYLVYTRAQGPGTAVPPGQAGRLDLRSVRRGAAADVVLLKLSYWWG